MLKHLVTQAAWLGERFQAQLGCELEHIAEGILARLPPAYRDDLSRHAHPPRRDVLATFTLRSAEAESCPPRAPRPPKGCACRPRRAPKGASRHFPERRHQFLAHLPGGRGVLAGDKTPVHDHVR